MAWTGDRSPSRHLLREATTEFLRAGSHEALTEPMMLGSTQLVRDRLIGATVEAIASLYRTPFGPPLITRISRLLPAGLGLELGRIALRCRDHHRALRICASLLRRQPAHEQAIILKSQILRCQGHALAALTFGEEALPRVRRPGIHLFRELIDSALAAGRAPSCRSWWSQLAKLPASRSDIDELELRAYRLSGQLDAARRTAEALLQAQPPPSADGVIEVARFHQDCGNWQDARALCAGVLRDYPSHRSALKLYHSLGVKHLSIPELRAELALWLKSPEPMASLAAQTALLLAYYEDEDWEAVIDLCNSEQRQALFWRLHCLLAQSQLEGPSRVRDSIDSLKGDHPKSDDVDLVRAEIARMRGDTEVQLASINEVFGRHGLASIQRSDTAGPMTIDRLDCLVGKHHGGGPLVSVIMTVFRRNPLLDISVRSILGQTHRNLELWIVDDASPDDTFAYLEGLARTDARIRLLRLKRNRGPYVAKNEALRRCQGSLITFMDSDDWSHPQRLAHQLGVLGASPDAVGSIHQYFRLDEAGRILFRRGAIRSAPISLLIRSEVRDRIGYFDVLRVAADIEYIERLQAAYERGALMKDGAPVLIASHRSTSLTGGGNFGVGWRSAIGARLVTRTAFRTWHRRVATGLESPYLAYPANRRPYPVPAEILA